MGSRSIPVPFCGWRGRRFVFKTESYSEELTGPRAVVEANLRKILPAWREVAVEKGAADVVKVIDEAIAVLPRRRGEHD